jgi:hypothetical protein
MHLNVVHSKWTTLKTQVLVGITLHSPQPLFCSLFPIPSHFPSSVFVINTATRSCSCFRLASRT